MDGFVVNNINPLMIFVQINDILEKIRTNFRSLSLRIDFINDSMIDQLQNVFQSIYRPREIELMLK